MSAAAKVLKEILKGQLSPLDTEVAAHDWIKSNPENVFKDRIKKLIRIRKICCTKRRLCRTINV